jgi:hypothetical protein
MCMYLCMYVYIYIYIYMYVRMYVCMYVCMHVCACVCVCFPLPPDSTGVNTNIRLPVEHSCSASLKINTHYHICE